MKFYVTRHGQTAWNRENLVCGITDLPLDETGREQARQTAQKLKDTHLDRVIVSPLLRARQTAELICQGRALPLSVDARVREQNYGIYEGVSRFDQGFLSHKRSFATRYPGGESHMSTAVRVLLLFGGHCPELPRGERAGGVPRGHLPDHRKLFPRHDQRGIFPVQHGQLRGAGVPAGAAPRRGGRDMVTFYGSHICGGCREAKELFAQKGFADFQFVEITESTDNLRAFLQLRDHREELRQAREAGMIGIPCFVREDGSITLEAADVLKEAGLGC